MSSTAAMASEMNKDSQENGCLDKCTYPSPAVYRMQGNVGVHEHTCYEDK